MEPTRYEIATLDDILNCVSTENVENFIEGFGDMLRTYLAMVTMGRLGGGNGSNTDIIKPGPFVYVDDGKQEHKVTVDVTRP